MSRIIDATLAAAMADGHGTPYLMGYLGRIDGTVLSTKPVLSYKLTGTTLQFETQFTTDLGGPQKLMWLERGVTLNGVNYTVTTGKFFIQSQRYSNGHMIATGALFPKQYYSAVGALTYKTVLDTFCTAIGKTAFYRNPTADWLNYQFFPAGKMLILNDCMSILPLLQQKYLIFARDMGGDNVEFYDCARSLVTASDHTITPVYDYFQDFSNMRARQYLWRDENGTVHTSGTATDPVHNLGYLETTAAAPARTTSPQRNQVIIRPNLAIVDGDVISLVIGGTTSKSFALVTEEYTAPGHGHPHPRWTTTIDSNEVFGNTAGGAMPSTIERVSNYTPVNTSQFNGILSANDNNLQALADRLDDHTHYVLQALAASFNPADSTTYYFGSLPSEPPQSTAGRCRVQIPKAGVIKIAKLWWITWGGVAGSAEQIDFNIRYNGVSYLIGTAANTGASKAPSNTALNIPVAATSLELEVVCPAWATNPTLVRLAAVIFIESTTA